MDAKALQKLTCAEGYFATAMLAGDEELAAYDFHWTSLLDEISQATLGDISNTTLAVADDVVARVSTLVECCLTLSSAPHPSFPVLDHRNTVPPAVGVNFITEAHSWLLENIASPYPSPAVKAFLAQRHNCSLSTINSWFINARRRIGWTALCRNSFNNCRADALDAAYRALVKEDPNRQLPADIVHAFVSVKVVAEELYSSTLTKSVLASELDTAVKDMLDQEAVNPRKCHGSEGTMEVSKALGACSQNKRLVAQNHYPSPDHSPSSSPVPALDYSLTDESEDDEDIVPPTLAGRKRRFSCSEGAVPMQESITRPMKRSRPSKSSPVNTCLPSPPTSTDEFAENERTCSVSVTRSSSNSKRRKRHLSDAGTADLPQCTRDSMPLPRLQTVPDPLPLFPVEGEHSLDDWFKVNFDALFTVPPAVDFSKPDYSTQWEVELFNNYVLPEDRQNALTPPIQGDWRLPSTDLAALDDLLQSLESGGFVAPPESMHPPPVPVPAALSHDLPLLLDLSQSIDWTTLLNEDHSESTSEPTSFQIYSSTLPEIDLSVLQLPRVWTMVAS